MEQTTEIPLCPPPEERANDMAPLVIVLAVFLLAGWGFRRWKRRRGYKRTKL